MDRFRNILYVADMELTHEAFEHAVALAERNDAQLTVMVVTEEMIPNLPRRMAEKLREMQNEEQSETLKKLGERARGRVEIEIKAMEGKCFLEVIREVLRHERDLVIKIAAPESDALGSLFGTTDMHLLRKCPVPLWLIKSPELPSIERVVAAVDFNELASPGEETAEPLNRMILELAGAIASHEQGELHVAHAWWPVHEGLMKSGRTGISEEEAAAYLEELRLIHEKWLNQLMDKAKTWFGAAGRDLVEAELHLLRGKARVVIPPLVEQLEADLLVMGTVGRTGIPGLIIGNTAESILGRINCSVLAVKPLGFVSPVTLEL